MTNPYEHAFPASPVGEAPRETVERWCSRCAHAESHHRKVGDRGRSECRDCPDSPYWTAEVLHDFEPQGEARLSSPREETSEAVCATCGRDYTDTMPPVECRDYDQYGTFIASHQFVPRTSEEPTEGEWRRAYEERYETMVNALEGYRRERERAWAAESRVATLTRALEAVCGCPRREVGAGPWSMGVVVDHQPPCPLARPRSTEGGE